MATTWELGLIGAGIQSSLTPALHEREAGALGLEGRLHYRLFDLDVLGRGPNDIGELIEAARLLGFAGLNITHPVKQAVIPYLDGLSVDAAAIGAVNTVVFGRDGAIGHNTDWYGFAELERMSLVGARNDHVVQLGAGGAGAAVAYAQLKSGVSRLDILDVDTGKGAALAASLSSTFPEAVVRALSIDALDRSLAESDGVVNTTPLGMAAHPGSPVPAELLDPRLWVIDVVYMPLETQLLRDARSLGLMAIGGTGMTVFQAVEAFRLFTGLTPDPSRMLKHMESLVRERTTTG